MSGISLYKGTDGKWYKCKKKAPVKTRKVKFVTQDDIIKELHK